MAEELRKEFSYDLKKTVLSFFNGKYRQPAKKMSD